MSWHMHDTNKKFARGILMIFFFFCAKFSIVFRCVFNTLKPQSTRVSSCGDPSLPQAKISLKTFRYNLQTWSCCDDLITRARAHSSPSAQFSILSFKGPRGALTAVITIIRPDTWLARASFRTYRSQLDEQPLRRQSLHTQKRPPAAPLEGANESLFNDPITYCSL